MSSTVIREGRRLDPSAPVADQPLAPPPKLRRRPALMAAAVILVCLGALLAAWAWSATTNTTEVLVARQTIHRGEVIDAKDLARVRLGADPAIDPIPAKRFDAILGQRAAFDIASGGLVTESAVTPNVLPRSDMSVVGIALAPGQSPALDLQAGDRVRVVVTPAKGDPPGNSTPRTNTAIVVGSRIDDTSGQRIVDVLVPRDNAPTLAARVATGNVAVVLDSRER